MVAAGPENAGETIVGGGLSEGSVLTRPTAHDAGGYPIHMNSEAVTFGLGQQPKTVNGCQDMGDDVGVIDVPELVGCSGPQVGGDHAATASYPPRREVVLEHEAGDIRGFPPGCMQQHRPFVGSPFQAESYLDEAGVGGGSKQGAQGGGKLGTDSGKAWRRDCEDGGAGTLGCLRLAGSVGR